MKNIKHNTIRSLGYARNGTTIIELAIYMGILAVILVVLAQLFGSAVDVRRESEATSYTTTDTRYLYNRFLYDISNADSITTPANLGDTSAMLQYVKDGVTHTYQLSASDLVLDSVKLNSFGTSVSNISFQRLGNAGGTHTIRLSYTVTSKVKKSTGNEIKTVTTTIGMR